MKKYLGDFVPELDVFPGVDRRLKGLARLGDLERSEKINRTLLELIQAAEEPCFLLKAVVDYIDRVHREGVEVYSLGHFEVWLNQFSGLTSEENRRIRGKVAGKWVPREEYQVAFPIGMDRMYKGSHYVTAHGSPDLDTTVASFWGWIDAFAARVSQGLHVWNVPGGPPGGQVEIDVLFPSIFGGGIFTHVAKGRTSLTVSGMEMMSQKGVLRHQTNVSTLNIDHERNQNAVVLVDKEGYYLGDWRNFDVEGVRQVIMLLNNCLRWFETNFHIELITLFAREKLSRKDLPEFSKRVFGARIGECEPAREFTAKQTKAVQDYLVKVLKVKEGLQSTFGGFAKAMKSLKLFDFDEFVELLDRFDVVEGRSKLFDHLQKIIKGLERAIQSVRAYVDRLDVALQIKTEVFGYLPQSVSFRAEVDEIRSKMGSYPYLTVTSGEKGKLLPLGVIHAADLHQSVLGTVSLRDFSNRDETKIPSYLEVISIVDHHKASLHTFSPPAAIIADAQSSNVLVAEMAFQINDRYSTGGMKLGEINAQIKAVGPKGPSDNRIVQRLLQKKLVAEQGGDYFISPEREFIEYFHFLYAILDDTDLLTKMSLRDILCVASLLNRMKSLSLCHEVEMIHFDDIAPGKDFVAKAAQRILQNADVYSIYRKTYLAKELSVEESLSSGNAFADTKEQNGCCRVGQMKLFSKNFTMFKKCAPKLRKLWFQEASLFFKERNEFDLHLQMVSTVPGAEELYSGVKGEHDHRDELWIWIPFTEQSIAHLKGFLNALRTSPQVMSNEMSVTFLGKSAKEYEQIFSESFRPVAFERKEEGLPIAVLRFRAGSINSRKAMISPYLPRLTD